MPAIITTTEIGVPVPEPALGIAVILTGSTGSLGSYLLDSLARQQHVRKIYCLNRAEDGGLEKQKRVSRDRGLHVAAWGKDRVEFLHVDLSEPMFGLTSKKYFQLLREATHIIHNQWPVNFNWDLSSFEPHIRGVRHLLDFCTDSSRHVEFLFLSTIGTVSHVEGQEPVAERPNHELSPLLGGYSASKLICELIIEEHAKSKAGHKQTAICRVGQIAGPALKESGMWNKQEWLPTIILSSKHMGVLPSGLGSLDVANWVPVDFLSEIVLELAGVAKQTLLPDKPSSSSEVTIYHAVNPHNVKWAALVPTVAKLLSIEPSNIVPWNKWVDSLRLSARGHEVGNNDEKVNLKKNPGLKLLDFFEALGGGAVAKGKNERGGGAVMPLLATDLSAARSKTLASLQPVGTEWMALWIKQMGF